MPAKKVRVLEDKAMFFEGQVSPLHQENQQLKEQLIACNRMLTSTPHNNPVKTKELRELLNPLDSFGRSRQLQL